MKALCTTIYFFLLLGFTSIAQVKIGLPAGPPQSSSILDLSNIGDGTRAFSLPRVASTATILAPMNGMLVYDISASSIKAYENGVWISYSSQTSATPAVIVNCSSSAINGFYSQGVVLTAANTVTIIIANNSFSAATLAPLVTDIVLSGSAASGMSVASASPVSISPGSGGGTSTITYTLSGTPTMPGSFTATFTKLSLSCSKTSTVCLPISPLTITNVTTPSTLPSTIAAGNIIDFSAAGGTNNTGVTWVMSSSPATGMFSSPTTGAGTAARAVLMSGASGYVTVVFTATNACGLLVTQTQTVSAGALYVNCLTSAINGIYTQGRALTASNTITMIVVNNAPSANTVTASTADIVFSDAGAAGITVASVSPTSLSIPSNGSTTFTYTLSGTPIGVGALTANYTNGPLSCAKTGIVCLDITPVTVTYTTTPSPLVSPIVAGNTINFTAAGGTNNTGISWVMTSSPATGIFTNPPTGTGITAQAILAAGSAGTVTVVFTATNTCGLIVTSIPQTAAAGDLQADCTASTLNGFYTQNKVLTPANTITMVIKNNGTSAKSFTPVTGNIALTGTGAPGMSVASVSPSTATSITAGGALNVVYTLGGTPTTLGNFTATFTSGTLNTCAKTGTVCLDIAPIVVTSATNPATLPNPTVAGNTITFNATGGTPNTTGINWTMTSSPATGVFSNTTITGTGTTVTANLVAGGVGTVSVTFSATNACGLLVSNTKIVSVNDALRLALVAGSVGGTCTSCAAYDNAAANTWVLITAAEYAQIDNFMPVNIAGATEAFINTPNANTQPGPNTFASVGSAAPALPANNYVIAFSVINGSGSASTNSYLKYSSSSQTSGFSMSGPSVVIPAGTVNTRIYNVMKRPSSVVNASSASYVAIFCGNAFISLAQFSGITNYFGTGDSQSTPSINIGNAGTPYQVKGTATKAW